MSEYEIMDASAGSRLPLSERLNGWRSRYHGTPAEHARVCADIARAIEVCKAAEDRQAAYDAKNNAAAALDETAYGNAIRDLHAANAALDAALQAGKGKSS